MASDTRNGNPVKALGNPRPAACRIIVTDSDIADGIRSLRRRCRVMRHVVDTAGAPPLRRRPPGFEGLARIIVGQQLSIASAEAIWNRVALAFPGVPPEAIRAATDQQLRAAGLSGPKIKTLRAAASAVAAGLELETIGTSTDEEVHAALTAISGIGPWTADIFLLFCLGRPDAFAAGDLALQIAAQHAFELEAKPSPLELLELAERWRPWRAVAARLLWGYYHHIKPVRSAIPV